MQEKTIFPDISSDRALLELLLLFENDTAQAESLRMTCGKVLLSVCAQSHTLPFLLTAFIPRSNVKVFLISRGSFA